MPPVDADPLLCAPQPETTRLPLVIDACRRESDRVVSIVLRDPDAAELPEWEAGAHIEVLLPSGLIRHYSLCGDPLDRTQYTIAVLREDAGRGGSREFHEIAEPGGIVDVRRPRNNFPLRPARHYLFLAGGIGITPLLPMMRQAERTGASWRLVYGGRTRGGMAFLRTLEQHRPGHLGIYVDDEPSGRPDYVAELAALPPDTLVYACGPSGMLDQVAELHAETGCPAPLHMERFTVEGQVVDPAGDAFEVELARSGKTVPVGADETILHALQAAGLKPDFSCDQGYCGTCEAFVVEGVPDHRDTYLTDEERDEGSVMICVSRCFGGRLVLDL